MRHPQYSTSASVPQRTLNLQTRISRCAVIVVCLGLAAAWGMLALSGAALANPPDGNGNHNHGAGGGGTASRGARVWRFLSSAVAVSTVKSRPFNTVPSP